MKFSRLSSLGGVGLSLLFGAPTFAQAIAPAADGTGTTVTLKGDRIEISGGTRSADGGNLFHSFQQFNIGRDRIADFLSQPEIINILSRVTGGDPSVINGLIQVSGGNSNLYLINPAGLIFGAGASLNVPADFIATTATGIGINDGWFNALGDNHYAALNGNPSQFTFDLSSIGAIVNGGNLAISPGRNLALLGGTVVNTGTLSASSGNLIVAAIPNTSLIKISQPGSLLSLEIQPPRDLNGQLLPFTALSLPQLLTHSSVENVDTGLTLTSNNQVLLSSSGTLIPTEIGTAIVGGNLNSIGLTGGNIDVLGQKVALIGARLDASGTAGGGGNIRIGGDYQGSGNIPRAARTYISRDSSLNANAGLNGDGGRIITWADEVTGFYGSAIARGGIQSGNGGFIEISGKENLVFEGNADASAANGLRGTILFDPRDINIIAGVGANDLQLDLNNPNPGDPASQILAGDLGAFTDFEISAAKLTSLLGDIILQASRDINLNTDLDFTGSPANSITFNAGRDFNGAGRTIIFPGGITAARLVEIGAGNELAIGNINTSIATPNSDIFGGRIRLSANGNISADSLNSSASLTLVGLGNAVGGSIEINAGGNVLINNLINASAFTSVAPTGSATATGGGVTINAGGTIRTRDMTTDAEAIGTPDVTATGGAITLIAGSTIETGELISAASATDTSVGTANATGGNITLQSGATPGSDIQFISITATGAGSLLGPRQGGTVNILANGRVRGTGGGTTIDTRAINQIGAAIAGAVTIQHDGGFNNVPFVIGDGSDNGLAGAINAGNAVPLAAGSFAVQPLGGSDFPQANITITSINTPPEIVPFDNPLATLQQGQSFQITFAELAAKVSDVNLDDFINNSIVISDVTSTGTLTLIRGGATSVIPAGATLKLLVGDVLRFTAADITGLVNLFDVVADDVVSFSNVRQPQVQVNLAQLPDTPTNPTFPDGPILPRFPFDNCPPFCGGSDVLKEPTPAIATSWLDNVEDRFTREFVAYGGMAEVNLRSVDRIREILREIEDNTGEKPAILYVTFIPLDANSPNPETDELELMVVTAKGVPFRRQISGVTRAQVMPVAGEFRSTVTNVNRRTAYLAPSKQLYDWIIAPVLEELKLREITNISFILEGGLRSLPVAALHDGQKFIIEEYSVGLMPSLSLVDTRYRDIKKLAVLGMGADTFIDLPALPAVPMELQLITQQLWPGELLFESNFTPEKLDEARGRTPYGIVHLATHAEFNSGKPENSFIQFWGNSRLSLDRIRELKLVHPPVELLVLSACRTALGDRESELGFAGLAAQAGVKSALGSLWYVSDEGTLGLMVNFYEQLKTASIKAEALRQTQLAMLAGKVRLEQGQLITSQRNFPLTPELVKLGDRNLSHPYYWSAFTLIGNPW